MRITLRIWRQPGPRAPGRMVRYRLDDVEEDMSFLEMLDVLNERLVLAGEDPVAFDHDCREGICGSCAMVIDGTPHGPQKHTTTCQLHMRHFADGDTIDVEPWRARAFPVLRDLVTDRSALDEIVEAGGYVSVNTGSAPDAHATGVDKDSADDAFDAATCIGCGACVAACPNGSSMLFTAAKVTHLGLLPQGQPERRARAMSMLATQDALDFGGCTNVGACHEACPKGIPLASIARLNHDVLGATLAGPRSER